MRLVQTSGLSRSSRNRSNIHRNKNKNELRHIRDTLPRTPRCYKAETVIAILEREFDHDAQPRHYGSIATIQHALERTIRLFLCLNSTHSPTIKPLQIKD